MENTLILDLLNDMRNKCICIDEELIATHNITLAEYNFFLAYDEHKILKSERISKELNISLSRVSRIIDRMVLNDLIIRETSSMDKRAINLKLSEKGLALYNKIKHKRIECENSIREKLSKEDSLELESNLKRILSLL